MSDGRAPNVIVDQTDYTEVLNKLNRIDEKTEFVSSEVAQRIGKKIGRDIGILYGAVIGLLLFVIYSYITSIF